MLNTRNYLPATLFWLVFFAAFAVFAVHLAVDLNGTRYLFGDDIWFQPIVQSVASGDGLAHPFLSPIEANGGGKLVWHGWLMPLLSGKLVGFLVADGNIAQAKFASNLIAVGIFTGFTLFFKAHFGAAKALLSIPIFLGLFLYQSGRPELVASIALLLVLMGFLRPVSKQREVFFTLIIAVTAVSSPVLGVYLSFIYFIHLFSSNAERMVCWRIIGWQLAAVPAAIALLTIAFTDLGISEWVMGVFKLFQRIAGRTDGSFFDYYVQNFKFPYVVGFIFLAALSCVWKKPEHLRIEVWLAGLTFLFLVYFSAIRVPPQVYNFIWFVPLILFFNFQNDFAVRPFASRLSRIVMIFLTTIYTISALFYAALAIENLRRGATTEKIVQALQVLPEPGLIFIERANIATKAVAPNDMRFTKTLTDATYYVEFQSITGAAAPTIVDGACLVQSTFHTDPITIFGMSLWYSRQDWAFAIIQLKNCGLLN